MRYLALVALLLWSSAASAQVAGAPASVKLATNLQTNTSAIGGTGWTNYNVTIATNNATGPDGGTDATTITGGNIDFCQTIRGVTLSASTTYTVSDFVKAGTFSTVATGSSDGIANAFGIFFNISTQALTDTNAGTGSVISHGFYPYPNGWYRIWVTGTFSSNPNPQMAYVAPWTSTAGTGCANGTTLFAWGQQVEKGSYPSTYVAN